jgi:hypothetical protein
MLREGKKDMGGEEEGKKERHGKRRRMSEGKG